MKYKIVLLLIILLIISGCSEKKDIYNTKDINKLKDIDKPKSDEYVSFETEYSHRSVGCRGRGCSPEYSIIFDYNNVTYNFFVGSSNKFEKFKKDFGRTLRVEGIYSYKWNIGNFSFGNNSLSIVDFKKDIEDPEEAKEYCLFLSGNFYSIDYCDDFDNHYKDSYRDSCFQNHGYLYDNNKYYVAGRGESTKDICLAHYTLLFKSTDFMKFIDSGSFFFDISSSYSPFQMDVDLDLCNELKPKSDFQYACLYTFAKNSNNSNACDEIPFESHYYGDCQYYFAQETNNVGLCGKIPIEYISKRVFCFYQMAKKSKNASLCEKIPAGDSTITPGSCIDQIARETDNVSLCYRIPKDHISHANCFRIFAQITKNLSLCYEISPTNPGREICISNLQYISNLQ
ncbi:hypothetical protein AYK26_00050 [Euryarchaeota archaeon SM23-78]|nr:MAG: hypothetical protein AYK26_00050 [Euryarchaeota archaeon SM23-78]MBW3000531.1 hypothetical protein [Candidatus Woesearchaeota archaeon]